MVRALGLALAVVVVGYGASTLPGLRPQVGFDPWLDGVLRVQSGRTTVQLSAYYNRVNDYIAITPRGQAKLLDAGLTRWLSADPAHTDDIAALGRLLSSMVGGHLPKAQWADDLRMAVDRTQPGHPRRYESVATLAAELRSVSAMLEVRAEATPRAPAGSGMSVLLWALLAVVLLGLGAWFLLQ